MQNDGLKPGVKSERFFKLFMANQNRIFAYILLLIHNQEHAEDIMQETAAVLWERFDEFDGENFAAWGVGIARNMCFVFMRKNRHTHQFDPKIYEHIAQAGSKDDQAKERLAVLHECLDHLDARDRKIIALRYESRFSVHKVAGTLGRSASGLYKALARIHGLLGNCVKSKLSTGQDID